MDQTMDMFLSVLLGIMIAFTITICAYLDAKKIQKKDQTLIKIEKQPWIVSNNIKSNGQPAKSEIVGVLHFFEGNYFLETKKIMQNFILIPFSIGKKVHHFKRIENRKGNVIYFPGADKNV
jgi:hypothetical protein